MKKIYYITIVLILFACCDKKKYYNIPKEDYFYFNQGETLFYKSNMNKTDTFNIYSVLLSYRDVDKASYYQNFSIRLIKIGSYPNSYNAYSIGAIGDEIYWLDIQINDRNDTMQAVNYTLNGHIINRVYITNGINQSSNPDITTIYFCKKYGVIRYDKKDGEYYELVMK